MNTLVLSSVEIDILEDKPNPILVAVMVELRAILQAPHPDIAPITPTTTLLTDNITSSQEFGGCCKAQKE